MNRSVLLNAVARALRPIVRLMIRHGEPSDVMEALVRRTYVEVAETDFRLPDRKPSASRISLLTGLHRREVARLRDRLYAQEFPQAAAFNRVEAIVAAWLREPGFQTQRGEPRVLPFTGPRSFTELVEQHGRDVPPRAVEDELLRIGVVERSGRGSLRLVTRGYIPDLMSDELLSVYGFHAGDFLNTLDGNVSAESSEDRLYQRQVIYNHIDPKHVAEFRRYSARLAQRVLEQLDTWLKTRKAGEDEPGVRLGLGIYQIRSDSHKEDTD